MGKIIDSIRENWILYLAFLIYAILIIVVVARHEPWADEAQAWLLARDSSLFGLLFKNSQLAEIGFPAGAGIKPLGQVKNSCPPA